jgi:hypothetical protein
MMEVDETCVRVLSNGVHSCVSIRKKERRTKGQKRVCASFQSFHSRITQVSLTNIFELVEFDRPTLLEFGDTLTGIDARTHSIRTSQIYRRNRGGERSEKASETACAKVHPFPFCVSKLSARPM